MPTVRPVSGGLTLLTSLILLFVVIMAGAPVVLLVWVILAIFGRFQRDGIVRLYMLTD